LIDVDFGWLMAAAKILPKREEKYYRRGRPIGRDPHGYWLPDQGSNLGPAD
jgi:hypothetical protein